MESNQPELWLLCYRIRKKVKFFVNYVEGKEKKPYICVNNNEQTAIMKKLSTPRTLTLVNKMSEFYTYESKDFRRFTIQKFNGEWEVRVEYIFHDQPEYSGTFFFDTLKNSKIFITEYYSSARF